jgi:hypothetical protein
VDDNNNNVVMMDRHVPPTIGCGHMAAKTSPASNATDPTNFPRSWSSGSRGEAWFFFPCGKPFSLALWCLVFEYTIATPFEA